ncbi:MAG: DUF1330 domain-containing protein [Rhodobacteraceae bacterium]|nr:DUF1330 domain-containing protein [Paracoccaceae bacterium]
MSKKGYWMGHIEVHDTESYAKYAEIAGRAVAAHGGEFLVRAGRYRVMEGTERPRHVLSCFPSFDAAVACYESELYQEALKFALPAATRDLVIVEGV